MAGSFPIFDNAVAQAMAWMAPARALDLGAGSGKYGQLLREQVPACERIAVEVQAGFAEQFKLHETYQQVHVADMRRWCAERPDEAWDVVIVGDCLQHLPKSDGLDLLNDLVHRCAWLLLLAPEFLLHDPATAADSDRHRSVWSERDLHWHDLFAWDNARTVTLAMLRCYRPSPLSIDELVRRMNEGQTLLTDFDGQASVRPCRLRLVDHAREVPYRPR